MQFTDIQNNQLMRQYTHLVQSHLVKAKSSLKAGNMDAASNRIDDALNQLLPVTMHLQRSYSIPEFRLPDHEPVLMWLDKTTLFRLQGLQEVSGYSMRQVIIDLLQTGELGEEYRPQELDTEG